MEWKGGRKEEWRSGKECMSMISFGLGHCLELG